MREWASALEMALKKVSGEAGGPVYYVYLAAMTIKPAVDPHAEPFLPLSGTEAEGHVVPLLVELPVFHPIHGDVVAVEVVPFELVE